MSNQCKRCRSYAINHNLHGRDGTDPDLCDVCYWRKRAEECSEHVVVYQQIDSEKENLVHEAGIHEKV